MFITRVIATLLGSFGRSRNENRVRMLIARGERAAGTDPEAALHAFRDAAAIDQNNARLHSLMGEVHIQAGHFDLAQPHMERSTALEATSGGLTQLGNIYQVRGDLARAEQCYLHALRLDAGAQLAHYNLALVLRSQCRFPEALEHLRAAHESAPLRGGMLRAFVSALLEAGEYDEAIRIAEAITVAEPACLDAWLCLGLARHKIHRPGEALACYDQALALGAADAEVYNSRAVALQELGKWPEAFAEYERALARDPNYALAQFHRGLARLANHRYVSGWRDYEARLLSAVIPRGVRAGVPWSDQPLAGATLLVYGEQGLGDEIMFASCLPDALSAAGHCVIECAPRLQGIFQRSFPAATVYAASTPPSAAGAGAAHCDFHVPLGSLPLRFRPSAADFPYHTGYLRAAPDRVVAWSERLRMSGPGLKVGVSWRGGTHKTRSPLRSLELARLAPILELPGITFVSLQYTPEAPAEIEALRARHGIDVRHWPEAIEDYEETAALVSALDLSVSVCTAAVHLAGALGRPVWVMAPKSAEWRYGHAGEAMPWYPSVRIFRQRQEGSWSEVIDEVARRLASFAGGGELRPVRACAEERVREGIAKLASGDFGGAQICFESALDAIPYLAEAHCNLGIALLRQGMQARGEHHLREAIDLDPGLLAARENLAVMLTARYEHDAAVSAWNSVLERDPRHASAHAAQASLAFREGQFERAIVLRQRALELGADPTPLRMQEATMLAMSGDTGGARRLLHRLSGEVNPHDLDWELALCALYERRFEEGWPLYEARLRKGSGSSRRDYHYPDWDGSPLRQGSLLILGEQGAGDEIMFASCYSEAISRAGRCVIECEPRLAALFTRSFPSARVVGQSRDGAHPELVSSADITVQVYCGSLPKLFRLRAETFPLHQGYLRPDPQRVAAWRRELRGRGKHIVGISWSGGLKHTRRSARSIDPAIFAELLRIPDAEFVSLQHDDDGSAAATLSRLSCAPVHVFPAVFADFDALAALVASLDCVVTVCSTVVHLAGALGATTLVLTPKQAEWRYLLEGAAMPWYPSVRLFRQRQSGGWEPVIREAHAALAGVLTIERLND